MDDPQFRILKLSLRNNLLEFSISKLINMLKDTSTNIGSGLEREKILNILKKDLDSLIKDYEEEEKSFSRLLA